MSHLASTARRLPRATIRSLPITQEEGPLQKLAPLLVEIEPPLGILRSALEPESEYRTVRESIRQASKLLKDDLKNAANSLGHQGMGLVFQALLRRSNELCVGQAAETGSGAMYMDRDDRVAGSGVDLDQLPGGRDHANTLAMSTAKLVKLLRIKLEDDGDLTYADCLPARRCPATAAQPQTPPYRAPREARLMRCCGVVWHGPSTMLWSAWFLVPSSSPPPPPSLLFLFLVFSCPPSQPRVSRPASPIFVH